MRARVIPSAPSVRGKRRKLKAMNRWMALNREKLLAAAKANTVRLVGRERF